MRPAHQTPSLVVGKGNITMNQKKKAVKVGIVFIVLLFVSGLVLMYNGNDAIVLATKKKEGILTAEQVKLAFDSVGGRMINEAVKEGQFVKKGDVIMEIDPTDTDLSIERLKAQIAQCEAQIAGTGGSVKVRSFAVDNDEQQSFRQIDQQRAAVASAQATLANCRLDYNRKVALVEAGALAQSQLDDSKTALDVAQAAVTEQQQILNRLLSGVSYSGYTDGMNLPTIAQQRQEVDNMKNDVEALAQQKKALEVQLKELVVAKQRLTLRAPEDGKIIKIIAKAGEMISPSSPVVILESNRAYYDIYVSEEQAVNLREGQTIVGTTVAGNKTVTGTIRLLTQAPGFADLKQTREKGQADLSAFQVRIYTEPQDGVLSGMTVEVSDDEFAQR